jgi:hypothetical protein
MSHETVYRIVRNDKMGRRLNQARLPLGFEDGDLGDIFFR